jgi:fluoride exporter
MPVFLAVALGGGAGALGRYSLDRLIERRTFSVFPWSTFAINMSGCLVIGVLIAALVDRRHTPLWLRTGVVVGVVGGYTTFSTFAQESLDLLEEGRTLLALGYVAGSACLGIAAVFAGTQIGRIL